LAALDLGAQAVATEVQDTVLASSPVVGTCALNT